MTREQKLEEALQVLLDQVDFRRHACDPTEEVGQCIPMTVFVICDEALNYLHPSKVNIA